MYLALHAATPKIEAYYQYYHDHHDAKHEDMFSNNPKCGSWVDWYGQVVCDIETLASLVDVDTVESGESSM
jgi:UDP-glucose:glycoprotein glucosyltransferase